MYKWVGRFLIIIVFVCGVLIVSSLCTKLDIAQTELRGARLYEEAMRKQHEAAEVDLDSATYKQWIYHLLWKDVEKKDDWKKEVEKFKKENGYYD